MPKNWNKKLHGEWRPEYGSTWVPHTTDPMEYYMAKWVGFCLWLWIIDGLYKDGKHYISILPFPSVFEEIEEEYEHGHFDRDIKRILG